LFLFLTLPFSFSYTQLLMAGLRLVAFRSYESACSRQTLAINRPPGGKRKCLSTTSDPI
jgi:hypothetical protein